MRPPAVSTHSEPGLIVSASVRSPSSASRNWSKYAILELGAEAHGAGVGRQRAEDQLEQRRLARAVGADQAQPVAAHDAQREIAHQRAAVERLGDVRKLGHEAARALAGIERELHVAEPRATLAALAAQRFEPAHAALVARAARLDPLADPGFLLRPELVELALRHRFGGELAGLARFVRR